MTKDILKLTATMLGLTDVTRALDSDIDEASQETKDKIGELICYLNYVLSSVTKEYMPLKNCEKVSSDSSCQIAYSLLSKRAVAIDKVMLCGQSVTFNLYPEYIKVGRANQQYEVFYNYIPDKISAIEDKVTLPLGLDEFVLVYGIASEYALSKLLYDEAAMWQSKFKDALENLCCHVKERRFHARKLK